MLQRADRVAAEQPRARAHAPKTIPRGAAFTAAVGAAATGASAAGSPAPGRRRASPPRACVPPPAHQKVWRAT
jgi:hypothetical protein